jgi:hypothetical protein
MFQLQHVYAFVRYLSEFMQYLVEYIVAPLTMNCHKLLT